VERTLFQFVWTHSWRSQTVIVLASAVSFPLILAALYIPKLIVNDTLRSNDFPKDVFGFEFEQLQYLVALCLVLLLLIFLNNGVKYFINITKGLTGERILRRIRYTIYQRVIRMPLTQLRQRSPGEVVQVIAAEVEPVGGFAGEIVATPVYQGGQLIVYLGFIVAQDAVLGLAAIILFPVQAYVIPKIQRIVVHLVQDRIRNVRAMTTEVTESVTGIEEMRLAAAAPWHLARISERLYVNFRIRYRIFLLKYAIKFANNVINNITPFFFYSFGGFLVIEGRMDLGALVAILAAYKDIASPWRVLLNFYQTFADISARYEAVVDSYGSEPLPEEEEPLSLAGKKIRLERVSSALPVSSGGVREVSLTLNPGQTTLVIGEEEDGRSELLRILSGLSTPASGLIAVGDEEGRNPIQRAAHEVSLVTRNPHIMNGSLRENVAYGMLAEHGAGDPPPDWDRRQREAQLTGATADTPEMDWVDYARLGLESAEEFDARAVEILELVGLQQELFARGLSIVIDPAREPGLVAAALKARETVRLAGEEMELENFVEPWLADAYLENASLAENLFFGVPDSPKADPLVEDPLALKALARAQIAGEVVQIGLEAAETLQTLLGSLGPESMLLDQLGLIEPGEREEYDAIVLRARRRGLRWLGRADRMQLVRLALQLTPMRHRLGILDDPQRRERLLAARKALRHLYAPPSGFTRFDAGGYVPGLPLIENILDGRPRMDRRDVHPSIEQRLERTMMENHIEDFVLRAGLRTDVGYAGNSLSTSQRRRLALARALVSRPSLLILDGVVDDDDAEQRRLRQAIRADLPEATIVYGTSNTEPAIRADQVVRVIGGRLVAAETDEPPRSGPEETEQ